MPAYFYHYNGGDKEAWKPAPVSQKPKILSDGTTVFATVLNVSKLVDGLDAAGKEALTYEGPFYLDWDSTDIRQAALKVNKVMDRFESWGVDLTTIAWFATGLKGFHAEIPQALFYEGKLPKAGIKGLPLIYKEMAFNLAIDTLDLNIYSSGKGRMWRIPNVQRSNGKYKVQLTVAEMRSIAPSDEDTQGRTAAEVSALVQARYDTLCSAPRPLIPLTPVTEAVADLHLKWAEAEQKVTERLKARKNRKPDPLLKTKVKGVSVKLAMQGKGVRQSEGFHKIAMQIAITAVAAGMTADEMVEQCQGLCQTHESDSNRYNTPEKRETELRRLYDYMSDNPGYEWTVAAFKSILTHEAPDLDNLPVTEEEVEEVIKTAAVSAQDDAEREPDEYADVAAGVKMSRFGTYIDSDQGMRRVCGISFQNVHLLCSMETGQLSAYEAEVLVNGRSNGRQTLELDTFASLNAYNKFTTRYGHAFQGLDIHVRGLMMRFVEEGKKRGKTLYILKREGLDYVNIPHHHDERLRSPFMVYATHGNVLLDPRVRDTGIDIVFQGFPDPRGNFQSDIGDAPDLDVWVEDPANKQQLEETLLDLVSMQAPETVGKMLGWYVACFWRMLFQAGYNKFPLLHINGPAGSGKTDMNTAIASLFFYKQPPKVLSPGSTYFAISEHVAGSASVPMLLDEYKPQDMAPGMHDKLRALFRDAYNCKSVSRGGGTRDNSDYRVLHHTQLAAPIVFIAEAAEEEAAVAERVVLVTINKPSSTQSLRQLKHYTGLYRNRHLLAILGAYLAMSVIEEWNVEKLQAAFDPIFAEARDKYMLTDKDKIDTLSVEELANKQAAKERNVYNYTVARFGIRQLRHLVGLIYEGKVNPELEAKLQKIEDELYDRMSDLRAVTQPEWAKVVNQLAEMTWSLNEDSPLALQWGRDYEIIEQGGKEFVEIALRPCYLKYRAYAAQTRSKILFAGDQAFMHAMKACSALTGTPGYGKALNMPNVYTLEASKLVAEGITAFKQVKRGAKK